MRNSPVRKPNTRGRRTKNKKKGTARLFVLGAAFAVSTLSVAAAHAQGPLAAVDVAEAQQQVMQFEIAQGPLGDVVAEFQKVSGVRVTLALDALAQIQSPGVTGRMTPERALRTLLAGTAVAFRPSGVGQVLLELAAQSESVEVTAGLPTVQSPKYSVPLRDIAQTVALVPREVIEEQGAVTLSDVMRNVPGITMQAGEGGGASNTAGDMFNMRGFNAANSLFVDGVRDDGLIARDVFNLEQVEVFMGPTGSDVGRGTAAGYVNMQSKVPHVGNDAQALVTVGSADEKRVAADLNWAAPMVAGGGWARNAAVRVNVLWHDAGVPGRNHITRENQAVAPSLALGVGTPTRLTVAGQFVRQENLPDYGVPGAAWDQPLTPTSTLAPRAVDQRNYYGSSFGYDFDRAEQNTYTVKVEHDLGRRTSIRNQTRYNRTHREAVVSAIQNVAAYNAATNTVTIARQGNERENTVVANQTSLSSSFATGPLRHAVNAGLELASEEQFAPALTGLGTRAAADLFNPNPFEPVTGFAPTRATANSRGESTTVAAYAFDSVELNQRWQVSGGLRWEHYDTNFQSVATSGVVTDLAGSGTLASGKAGVLFRVSEAGNVYGSVGTSLTPPGSANFTLSAQANNQNNPNVEPQRSTNYEVGTKWDVVGGRLSLTGAVFHTKNENVIFTVDATAVPPIFNQDDRQDVSGLTLGALGRITDRWQVLASFGYLASEQRTQNAANNGRRLVLTPAYSGSLWTTVDLPTGLKVGGGVRHVGAAYVNAANTIQVPGYQVVDALAEYPVNTHLSLRVNGYNLANERYIRSVNNNGGRYNPGYPRSAALTLNVRY